MFYYYGARYYDPHTGRFTQPDKLALEDRAIRKTLTESALYRQGDGSPSGKGTVLLNLTPPTGQGDGSP